MQPSRDDVLGRIQHLLNTPDGELLMDELAEELHPYKLMAETPELTAYNVGKRDVYIFLSALRNGDLIASMETTNE